MASTFKTIGSASIGAAPVTIYTVPGATTTIVQSLTLANVTGAAITVDIVWRDSSAAADYYICKTCPIPAGGAVVPIGDNNKKNLETGDLIKITSSAATSIDASLDYLELT